MTVLTPDQTVLLTALKAAVYERNPEHIPLFARNLPCVNEEVIEELSSAAAMLLAFERWDDAIAIARKVFASDALHINTLDALSHAYGAKQDWANCAVFGGLALQLRDKNVLATLPKLPKLPALPTRKNAKNIIAFSLYGDSAAYIEPAVINTQIAADVYPNWLCRFYIDDSVPAEAVARLRQNGAQIVHMPSEKPLEFEKLAPTMWRFLAMDDPNADAVIFRDADSVISQREAAAVAEWLASGERFHTIRDSGSHTELILAGLWGAKAGSVPDLTGKMLDYMQKNPKRHRFSDQYFLRECVWGYLRQDVFAHDRIFGFMNAKPLPHEEFFDFSVTHIGCDEGSSRFTLESRTADELPVGAQVKWQLFSRIEPLLNVDLSHNLGEERLICEYRATIETAGKLIGNVPRRYARGFDDNSSKIVLKKFDE